MLGPEFAPVGTGNDFAVPEVGHEVAGFVLGKLLAVFFETADGDEDVGVPVVVFGLGLGKVFVGDGFGFGGMDVYLSCEPFCDEVCLYVGSGKVDAIL